MASGAQVTDYRLYRINDLGKIGTAEWIDARSDDEALAMVRAKRLSVKCELWAGSRLVAQIPPNGS